MQLVWVELLFID